MTKETQSAPVRTPLAMKLLFGLAIVHGLFCVTLWFIGPAITANIYSDLRYHVVEGPPETLEQRIRDYCDRQLSGFRWRSGLSFGVCVVLVLIAHCHHRRDVRSQMN